VTDRPVVALVADPGTAHRAVPVLSIVGRQTTVVSWQRRGGHAPDAVVATSLAALEGADGAEDLPWAVWVRDEASLVAARARGAAIVLTANAELVAEGAVLVPPVGIEVDHWPSSSPVVRARRRQRLGLTDQLVVRIPDDEDPAATGGLDAATTGPLATCAAAVVHGPAALVALALGAPTVTSAETARRLGLRPGRDVEVATGPSMALALAEQIAGDEPRAAVLSRRGRRCAEHHLDLGAPARALADALGVATPLDPMADLVRGRLAELGSTVDGEQGRRVTAALAGLAADGGGSAA
jgi:hypothetical protein